MKISVIDIGTNSIHALIAELGSQGVFRVLLKDKEMIRLGDDTLLSHQLSPEAIDVAVKAVSRFVEIGLRRGVEHFVASATSAVREASNGGELIDQIYKSTGIKVQVITGGEEARLIDLAVMNSVDLDPKKNSVIVDIGGGSTEIILKEGFKTVGRQSIKMGSNRLRQMVPLSDPPKKSELQTLNEFLQKALIQLIQLPVNLDLPVMLGTSGTMNAVARILTHKHGLQFKSQKKVAEQFSLKQIKDFYKELCGYSLKEKQSLKGLDEKRVDMIVQGFAYVIHLMEYFDAEFMSASEQALREGMIYDYMQKHQMELEQESKNLSVRERSVLSLLDRWSEMKVHSQQVQKLSFLLFDDLKNLHGLEASDRELLGYASLLHDIGYSISYHKHHKHGAYLLRNADLAGFSPEEVEMMASIIRLHRRNYSKDEKHFSQLSNPCKIKVLKLAALLRIADGLDHSHFELIEDLKIEQRDQDIIIQIQSSQDIEWEIYEALKRSDLFVDVYERKVNFKQLKG